MSCKSILPINIDRFINVLDLTGCERIKDIEKELKKIENFNDPLTIDESFLNLIADEYEVWFLSIFKSEELRKLTKLSQNFYSKLGTVYAVKEVLKIFDIKTQLKEWFEYKGDPYHFKIILTPTDIKYRFDKEMFNKIVGLIDRVKNVRSVLDGFEIDFSLKEEIKTYSIFTSNPVIDKEAKTDFSYKETIHLSNSKTYCLSIAKQLKKNMIFSKVLSYLQGAISNVSFNSILNLDLKEISNNKIQGAITWRV